MNILHVLPDFSDSCGMSRYVYLLLSEHKKSFNDNLYCITNTDSPAFLMVRDLGVICGSLNFQRGSRNLFTLIINFFRLRKFCIRNKIDVIHTHHRYPELLAVMVAYTMRIKTVTTAHSFVTGLNLLSFKSAEVVAVSGAIRRALIEDYHVPSSRITLLYNFLKTLPRENMTFISSFKAAHNIKRDERLFLFMGRINVIKGCDILISAFDRLNKKYNNIKLIVAGKIESPEIEPMLCGNSNIMYVGSVGNPSDFYALADAVVMPSRSEPFGYVAIEAGFFHKPLIASRVEGIGEIVGDEKNAFLCNVADVDDLEMKMEEFLVNPLLAKEKSVNFHERIKIFFDGATYVSTVRKIYER